MWGYLQHMQNMSWTQPPKKCEQKMCTRADTRKSGLVCSTVAHGKPRQERDSNRSKSWWNHACMFPSTTLPNGCPVKSICRVWHRCVGLRRGVVRPMSWLLRQTLARAPRRAKQCRPARAYTKAMAIAGHRQTQGAGVRSQSSIDKRTTAIDPSSFTCVV